MAKGEHPSISISNRITIYIYIYIYIHTHIHFHSNGVVDAHPRLVTSGGGATVHINPAVSGSNPSYLSADNYQINK